MPPKKPKMEGELEALSRVSRDRKGRIIFRCKLDPDTFMKMEIRGKTLNLDPCDFANLLLTNAINNTDMAISFLGK